MKKSLLLGIIIGLVAFMAGGFQAHATDVGGIIYSDTTWTLAGSPYNLTAEVQVAEGVTLTIEPGVVVNGGISNADITLGGSLNAIGNSTNKIILNNVDIYITDAQNAAINIQFAEFNSGSPCITGNYFGTTILTDSIIRNGQDIRLKAHTVYQAYCYIERNIFINSRHLMFLGGGNKLIANNVFYNTKLDFYNCEQSTTVIENNSFLSTDQVVIELIFDGCAVATNNFWNTTDTSVIDSMIYDGKDDINISALVEYVPFLTEPHPDTPIPDFNQPPTADCVADRVVFDEVAPDGSASADPDGSLVNYYWKVAHKSNPSNYLEANGVNPTISGLTKDFYDMCLTVTDDLGATDIDCCLLAAAGSCSCTPTSIHVESIIPTTIKGTKGQRFGQVTVLVADDCGNPVTSVDVKGTFSGDYFNETLNGVTGADGTVILTTNAEAKKPTYTFCVDSLVNAYPYNPGDNVEDCDELN